MRKKGSFTIELSLIIPELMGVIFLVIFMGFYMHDTVVIDKSAYTCVKMIADEKESPEYALNVYFDQAQEDALLGNWDIKRELIQDTNAVSITVSGKMNSDGIFIVRQLNTLLFSYETKCSAEIINECQYIRSKMIEY